LGSIYSGAPIYYHGIPVGRIQTHRLSEDKQTVEIHAFVWEPHDELLNSNSRFWNVSGIDFEMGADGMKVNVESLEALLAGGVEFESSRNGDNSAVVDDQRFKLYANQREMEEDVDHEVSITYVAYFQGNARGLRPGAPLTFMGIKIGEVSKVNLQFDANLDELLVLVTLQIEPENIGGIEGARSNERARRELDEMIQRGLRAQLQTGSLITGELLVELDFHPDEPAKLYGHDSHPELPTIPSTLEGLTEKVDRVLAKIEGLPLESLIANADTLVQDIQSLVTDVDQRVAPLMESVDTTLGNADATLESARQALDAVNVALAPDSAIRYDLSTALEELAAAMRSVRILAGYLERHPDALLFGKSSSGGRR
ncbi:MAG: PqiB family protein, partial [Planctomycetota bacterium]